MKRKLIYMDNAASSFPKPPSVWEAMKRFMLEVGANPGRSGHSLSVEASEIIFSAREAIAELLGVRSPLNVVFCKNATEALNTAIFGLLRSGGHAVTTSMEHNSVMRPLRFLEKSGVIELTVVKCSREGLMDPDDIKKAVRKDTKLVIMVHGSNVFGSILPVGEIGRICREMGIPLLVDASQTAGACPVNVEEMCIDILAFTGHKSLFGPQGTGGLCFGDDFGERVMPLMMGGTGSKSELEEQPEFLPDKFESGTPNTVGIAGLLEGVKFIKSEGVENIRRKELEISSQLFEGLLSMDGVKVYGPTDKGRRISIVSFNVDGVPPSEVARFMEETSGVLGRPGLHCAPSAHKTIGTFPQGTMRLSPAYFNSSDDVVLALEAVRKIVERRGNRGKGG